MKKSSYREKNNGDGESDGHQHSQTHAENQDIQRVHLTVGV